jgi:hypothetical protein
VPSSAPPLCALKPKTAEVKAIGLRLRRSPPAAAAGPVGALARCVDDYRANHSGGRAEGLTLPQMGREVGLSKLRVWQTLRGVW